MTPLLILLIALAAIWFAAKFVRNWRRSFPAAPALIPGEIVTARDPEFFVLQTQIFRENGYGPEGDYVWEEAGARQVMRLFRRGDGEAYGWAREGARTASLPVRDSGARTLGTDGSVLETVTDGGERPRVSGIEAETVAFDTELLLRRHAVRLASWRGQGHQPAQVPPGEAVAFFEHHEAKLLQESQAGGNLRLRDGRLRYAFRGALTATWRQVVQSLTGRRRRAPS